MIPEVMPQQPDMDNAYDHTLKIQFLWDVVNDYLADQDVIDEAFQEISRYKDQGMLLQELEKEGKLTTKKITGSKTKPTTYSGKGILFTIFNKDRQFFPGPKSTVEIMARAIDEALDNGCEDSKDIARYLTTHSFQHVEDKTVRFNSVLKAGDAVGAKITSKLFNAYSDLKKMARTSETDEERDLAEAEAQGFLEAIAIVMSPFSCESPTNSREVDWEMVDHVASLYEDKV